MEPKNNDNNNNHNNNSNTSSTVNTENITQQRDLHFENKQSVNLNDLSFLKSFMNQTIAEEIFLEL